MIIFCRPKFILDVSHSIQLSLVERTAGLQDTNDVTRIRRYYEVNIDEIAGQNSVRLANECFIETLFLLISMPHSSKQLTNGAHRQSNFLYSSMLRKRLSIQCETLISNICIRWWTHTNFLQSSWPTTAIIAFISLSLLLVRYLSRRIDSVAACMGMVILYIWISSVISVYGMQHYQVILRSHVCLLGVAVPITTSRLSSVESDQYFDGWLS